MVVENLNDPDTDGQDGSTDLPLATMKSLVTTHRHIKKPAASSGWYIRKQTISIFQKMP